MQNPPPLPPAAQLFQMMTGFAVTKAIFVAAKLGVADLLANGPRSADDLARQTGVSADALYRVLRALASVGVFAETGPRTFTLTPMAETLRSDVPGSQRAAAIMIGDEQFAAWTELMYSVQTGKPAFDKVFGEPIFDYIGKDPQRGLIFDAAMTSIHGPETGAMIGAYDFSALERIIDIGGGNGSTALEILRAAPTLRAVVFDLPPVIERTRALLPATGLADRCAAEPGSFFESVPAAGPRDAYILRHILHDWDDERCVQILQRCREAAAPGARVLIVESVIPPGNEPHPGKWLDLIMLAVPGGRERTAEEFESLLARAGLRLGRIIPTPSPVSIVEATVGG